jgi:hypothetical protein
MDTVNCNKYVRQILQSFFGHLTDEKLCGHFEQDSAPVHIARHSMQTLHEVFDDSYKLLFMVTSISRH